MAVGPKTIPETNQSGRRSPINIITIITVVGAAMRNPTTLMKYSEAMVITKNRLMRNASLISNSALPEGKLE